MVLGGRLVGRSRIARKRSHFIFVTDRQTDRQTDLQYDPCLPARNLGSRVSCHVSTLLYDLRRDFLVTFKSHIPSIISIPERKRERESRKLRS